MEHRRQHWVPSSYLSSWCDPDTPAQQTGYVWRFDRNGKACKKKSPAKLFAESNFYTRSLEDGGRDLALERLLGFLETRFCEVRDAKILGQRRLDAADFAAVIMFMAAMRSRTRPQRDALRGQWGHALRVMDDMRAALSTLPVEERIRLSTPPSGPTLSRDDVARLAANPMQHMLTTMIEEDVVAFQDLNLTLLVTDDDLGFITSDHPCIAFDPASRRRPPLLTSDTIEITMPVTPHFLALLCHADFPQYAKASTTVLDSANWLRRSACQEHFVVRRSETRAAWFV